MPMPLPECYRCKSQSCRCKDGISLYCGDCRDVLPHLTDLDGCCTDPPYGLEFMGQDWDHGVPGPHFWEIIGAAMKPGAPLLAFGGTRTYHRLVCAIEDAGFEIRDCLMWLYACLSEDTEILVDGEWVPYHKAIAGKHALCYDVGTDEYSWQPIEQFHAYAYCDTAYRIQSDHTDQIVSRNHRCLVERGGSYAFQVAEEVARQREARVPVLEDLQGLLEALPVPDERASDSEQDVLASMCSQSHKRAASSSSNGNPQCGLCRVREAVSPSTITRGPSEVTSVLSSMQRSASRTGVGQTCAQGTSCLDRGRQGELSTEDVRVEQSGVERRSNVLSEARQLQASQVCTMPVRVSDNGSQRRLCNGAPVAGCEEIKTVSVANRDRASHRPRSSEQQLEQSATLRVQSEPQAVRASWYTYADLARVTPVFYRGMVWCVKVPTGAFVVRRRGKVFVTGNSGFPKSHDISKAIDKAAGAKREVVGYSKGRSGVIHGGGQSVGQDDPITAPATEAAKVWDGWGTALSPAWEPIVVAMKPLDGTFAQNALEHGVAGINVDGGRIGTEERRNQAAGNKAGGSSLNMSLVGMPQDAEGRDTSGRWPKNVILSHHPDCVCVGTRKVKGSLCPPAKPTPDQRIVYRKMGAARPTRGIGDPDGTETVEKWECVDGCPVKMLDEQSGVSSGKYSPPKARPRNRYFAARGQNAQSSNAPDNYGDTGGASRFYFVAKASGCDRGNRPQVDLPLFGEVDPGVQNQHPTVKPTELMQGLLEYLLTLIATPTGGVIVDPFCGSASTLVAAKRLGRRAIGIELDEKWCKTAAERLNQEPMPAGS